MSKTKKKLQGLKIQFFMENLHLEILGNLICKIHMCKVFE
jgi:hypothetical protein